MANPLNVGTVTVEVKPDTSSFRESIRKSLGDMVPIMLCDALNAIDDQRDALDPVKVDFNNPDQVWAAALDTASAAIRLAAHDQLNIT